MTACCVAARVCSASLSSRRSATRSRRSWRMISYCWSTTAASSAPSSFMAATWWAFLPSARPASRGDCVAKRRSSASSSDTSPWSLLARFAFLRLRNARRSSSSATSRRSMSVEFVRRLAFAASDRDRCSAAASSAVRRSRSCSARSRRAACWSAVSDASSSTVRRSLVVIVLSRRCFLAASVVCSSLTLVTWSRAICVNFSFASAIAARVLRFCSSSASTSGRSSVSCSIASSISNLAWLSCCDCCVS
mmetsp:Transcript_10941/g.33857  ORF Transcript_10941/g.33857 Transcript_10941/m.33857 type:complete len:249 (+) Transcript_10941:319-1065(+)